MAHTTAEQPSLQQRNLTSDIAMEAYEETIRETATEDSPWYVVPADHKWFTRVIVAAAVIDALASLNLHYPQVSAAKKDDGACEKQPRLWRTHSGFG
jgi:hypothetical protein